ncbi:MAG: hypothetical protein B7Z37_16980 [Verrucomicrobia bacterium 12-59-8]|nr:MAG: hypothetical protein B7Z37_16980 [Verrucomicrobia bacterium 12-59-8]
MAKKNAKTTTARKQPGRFAHPFFTLVPPEERSRVPGVGQRLTDHIKGTLLPIPAVRGDSTMTLADVIGKNGAKDIEANGLITFHAVGDTGNPSQPNQQMVADAMTEDYNIAQPHTAPAFFMHLGDVNYYNNTDNGYHAQFYEPYKTYPGKIIAIPGNHDGELFKYDGSSVGQKQTLEAFIRNFCQKQPGVPAAAGSIYREMVAQPGVYWLLDTPFATIIGLYSNAAENPGYIAADSIGDKQKKWLIARLKDVASARQAGTRKALIIAAHHPALSKGGHSGSDEMLADIDEACSGNGLVPDLVLGAHAHNYQRFTRTVSLNGKPSTVPYIVAGCGGRGITHATDADGAVTGDHSYDKSLNGYGYLTVTVSKTKLTVKMIQVTPQGKSDFDTVSVKL